MELARSGTGRTSRSGDDAVRPSRAGLVRRAQTFAPEPGTPGRARALLRRTLLEADRLDCLDAAELACTELVTNAVLHAHTDVVVTVDVAADVLVEVRDASPTLPHRRHYDAQATTGRGLALVAALTDEYGVADLGPDGKTVWFTVGCGRERTEEEVLSAWDLASWDLDVPDAPPVAPGAGLPVRLPGMPCALWLAARQHHDALLRELVLYQARHPEVEADLARADRARFLLSNAVSEAADQQRRAAGQHGEAPLVEEDGLPWQPRPVDLEVDVPLDMAPDFAALQDTLDVAEGLARAGHLLTRPGLPEIIAVRDWACEQVVAQLAGIPSSPWPGADLDRFTVEVHDRVGMGVEGVDLTALAASPEHVVVADESNRLVAVSEPLARLLGWQVTDLVGHRIVALIPHRLREAHVAGFTRHQSTGESHILGREITVPVLRADGTEVACYLRIEHLPGPTGRSAYVARLRPVDEPGHD